jgi:hypothetical protein
MENRSVTITTGKVTMSVLMEKKSTSDYLSDEFEILGIANSARWIGYKVLTIINGRKIYNRIIIRRKRKEHK